MVRQSVLCMGSVASLSVASITFADMCGGKRTYYSLVPRMADFPVEAADKSKAGIRVFELPTMALHNKVRELPDSSKVNRRLGCALFHAIRCQCRESIHWGAVKSCPRCYTDYAFNVIRMPGGPHELPGNDRCFVFTTWKHVNGAEEDKYWRSHTDGGLQCCAPRDWAGVANAMNSMVAPSRARNSATTYHRYHYLTPSFRLQMHQKS